MSLNTLVFAKFSLLRFFFFFSIKIFLKEHKGPKLGGKKNSPTIIIVGFHFQFILLESI